MPPKRKRRGGRVAEGAPAKEIMGLTPIEGSNPSLLRHFLPIKNSARVAQLDRVPGCNQAVGGSTPSTRIFFY